MSGQSESSSLRCVEGRKAFTPDGWSVTSRPECDLPTTVHDRIWREGKNEASCVEEIEIVFIVSYLSEFEVFWNLSLVNLRE